MTHCQSLRIVGFASHQPHAFREAVLSGFNIAALANRRFDITLDIYPTIARIFAELDKLDAFAKAAPPRQPDAA